MSTEHKKIHKESGDKSQIAAFRKAARKLGADKSSEDEFQGVLRTIAKAKPSPHPAKQNRKRKA